MLLCLLGVTWIFGYLVAVSPISISFAYIFTVLNSIQVRLLPIMLPFYYSNNSNNFSTGLCYFQGVFILIFHVIANDKARAVLGRWFRKRCSPCLFPSRKSSSAINSSSIWSSGVNYRLIVPFICQCLRYGLYIFNLNF